VQLLRSIRSTYGRTVHTATGQTLSFTDDDHASGVVASRAELDIAGQTVHCAMRYIDDYERQRGRWCFFPAPDQVHLCPAVDRHGRLDDRRPGRSTGPAPRPARRTTCRG